MHSSTNDWQQQQHRQQQLGEGGSASAASWMANRNHSNSFGPSQRLTAIMHNKQINSLLDSLSCATNVRNNHSMNALSSSSTCLTATSSSRSLLHSSAASISPRDTRTARGGKASSNDCSTVPTNTTAGSLALSLKYSLPPISRSASGAGLSTIPRETLQACLQPILQNLASMDAESLLGLQRCGDGPSIRNGVHVLPIHEQIQPPTPPEKGRSVRYLHLAESEGQYSMGIFVFPPYTRIPLHDHPGMCVLSRVLYGDLTRLSLDLAQNQPAADAQQRVPGTKLAYMHRDDPIEAEHYSSSPWRGQETKQAAQRNYIDHLQAPDCTLLYPYEGNLHEFVAGRHGAAVLDVLLPPYNGAEDRDCNFYEIQEGSVESLIQLVHSSKENRQSQQGGTGIAASFQRQIQNKRAELVLQELEQRRQEGATPCWIVPTGQPEGFHCISGTYDLQQI